MSYEMIKTSLGDFIDFRNGKSSPDRTPEGEFDVFGSNGVIGQCEEKNASEFSLIIGRVGSYCGSVYQSKKACWVTDNAIIGALRNKDESNFWYFLLTRLDINAMSSGSGQPLINQKILKNIQVRVPLSSSTRVDIGNYLSLFNEKIKVNDDINQTLEQMAQALFKSWFVDFEPVKAKIAVLEAGGSSEDATLAAMTAISGKDADALAVFEREHPEQYAKLKATAELFPSAMQDSELGEIPEEWSVASISDMGKITCGKTPSKKEPEYFGDDIPFIKIPDMHGQLFVLKTNEYLSAAGSNSQLKKLVPANSICVSCIATIGVVSITNEPSHTNQQINSVTPHKSSFLYYIYFCMLGLKDYLHVLGSAGSATLNVNTSTFSGIKIAQPDDKVLDLFHAKCTHLFNEIKSLSVQTESLAQLRDTLLPKLLSGEITLPQAEQAVSEAENV
ncbi:TPA: restriction endonuclease subunit S [Yersinia enterocolitica]|uniref:restriction endonuclease subunit S n=1 Tax=Yersinia enterocolitica TaxID=630 RepID=UPI00067B9130|nr:restriction endonuclease subunit S [Yersinia enterocolitica]EKN6041367.1 restriction endonuclease subunit S [Yersinia enterocolitica]HDM9022182.1 restriction endonuclease subunit S [Yersinia enterocolitica]HDU2645088.1 restriction endonuclease subunit S [Yersinia enterocolitica]HDW8055396.1 restriction endonuclease subunit S [Yersinia enterocolitica]HEF7252188.1 restriction endonuclease subunit S [Yersinia enterocolitica]